VEMRHLDSEGNGDTATALRYWGNGDTATAGLGAAGSAAALSSTAGFGAGDGRAPAGDRGDGAPVGGVLLQALGGRMVRVAAPSAWSRFFFFLSRDLVSVSGSPSLMGR
jgi:hypothetical protein